MRRQSSSFKIQQQQQEATENLFEIEDMKLSPDDDPMNIDTAAMPPASPAIVKGGVVAKDEKHGGSISKRAERTSIGRPLRKAAEKVQSYKEIPLNTKMRRND